MQKPHKISFNEIESPQLPDRDVFDPDPVDEDDLWFLPGPDHAVLDAPQDMPGPRADQTALVDVPAWAAAEAALARPLADLGMRLGGLAARLGQGPAGLQHRLALQEAADLSWLAGDRVPAERLALWLTLRLAGDQEDAQALARAGWAARRLQGGLGPRDDLAGFLGRQSENEHLIHQIADWQEVMGQAAALHPISRAALGFHIWPVVGLSAGHRLGGAAPLPLMEAAVVAARYAIAAQDVFLPLALGGAGGLQGAGRAQDRLQRWIAGADHATRAAVRLLDRVAAWETRAGAACAGLSGRTPPQLIRLLRDWPLVSAPMAEAETGASRAAIQRNLNWMTAKGIIREVTGQGRYRFWTADL
ncbi:DNA binding protein with HTH domain [Yoonia maricola]|uniref:DNA binding protein with HTH domain n=1 Tax=Yoonia maricola TaxID=420999 RepID=A0A2M8W005_9RHOB|nr:helix-turn-helix domain-containing protein [Yoonia maricola]PJI84251.1 DNA binding protein with HTH domain [Yoonia maricola]